MNLKDAKEATQQLYQFYELKWNEFYAIAEADRHPNPAFEAGWAIFAEAFTLGFDLGQKNPEKE